MAISDLYLDRMRALLAANDIIGATEAIVRRELSKLIMAFQDKARLRVDGVAGPVTLWKLQLPETADHCKLPLIDCPTREVIDRDTGKVLSFGVTTLRADAAERFRRITDDVARVEGVVTSSGGLRPLTVSADQSRSSVSMHYPGLAFDLSIRTGFMEPQIDPFVVARNPARDPYWTVWCRADKGESREIEAYRWNGPLRGGTVTTEKVRGRFVDFTQICLRHGFRPIPPRSAYTRRTDRMYLSAEWWHFQASDLLVPKLSLFGIELLRCRGYTEASVRKANPDAWARRDYVFGERWQ